MERKAVSQNSSRPFSVPQLSIKRARPTQFYLQSVGKHRKRLLYRLARLDPSLQIMRIGSISVAEAMGHSNGCNPAFTENCMVGGVVRV